MFELEFAIILSIVSLMYFYLGVKWNQTQSD